MVMKMYPNVRSNPFLFQKRDWGTMKLVNVAVLSKFIKCTLHFLAPLHGITVIHSYISITGFLKELCFCSTGAKQFVDFADIRIYHSLKVVFLNQQHILLD